jgi:hypothetical protein
MTGRWMAGALALGITAASAAQAFAETKSQTLSGPFTHKNLTIWLVRVSGQVAASKLITLQEAMERKLVRVHETGNVRRLRVENLSNRQIYIQAGDILKGGRQDRVITSDLILPPKSGLVAIGAYCVERGRWSRRGKESDKQFASAKTALPSRKLKIALYGGQPAKARSQRLRRTERTRRSGHAQMRRRVQRRRGGSTQDKVWRGVARLQKQLEKNVKSDVRSKSSRTSLQLSLENKALRRTLRGYQVALGRAPDKRARVIGVVVVINGKVSTADVYAHPVLFRKMWPKLLHAAATEAIAEQKKSSFKSMDATAVQAFLSQAHQGGKLQVRRRGRVNLALRKNKKSIFSETRVGKDNWVHRSYVAY